MGFTRSHSSWVLKTVSEDLATNPVKSKLSSSTSVSITKLHAAPENLVEMHTNVKDVSKETGVDVARILLRLDQIMKEAIKIATKEEEWRRPTSNLGKIKSFSFQVSHKTLSKVERKILKTHIVWRASSRSRPLDGIVLLHGTIRRRVDFSFHRLFDLLPSGLRILEQRAEFVLSANHQRFLAMLMLQLLHSFQPFCSFFHLHVHASTKTLDT
ncbi:hypothetical protein H5410_045676 [Solanum commersonii]|uniref:Uncharacterized protein n=1 Tax=Solanum commersonii TaxID=4109 RepID=A0A9J5XBV7_SOLCO|nr:hypothetical protein H5410_045676 [Solanum commersonii]